MLLDRQRSYACIHPETYKYFFRREAVLPIWWRLEEHYGPIVQLAGFGTMQIDGKRLLLRSVAGNPITVIRKRRCTDDDIFELHTIFDCHDDLRRIAASLPESSRRLAG